MEPEHWWLEKPRDRALGGDERRVAIEQGLYVCGLPSQRGGSACILQQCILKSAAYVPCCQRPPPQQLTHAILLIFTSAPPFPPTPPHLTPCRVTP